MSTFDDQTDFSFLSIAETAPVKQAPSSKVRSVDIGGQVITLGYSRRGCTGQPRSAETKAKIGAANSLRLKGRTYTPEPGRGLKISLGKARPVVTPLGHFRLAREAAVAHGVDVVTIYRYILKYPLQYYYKDKQAK
jgi:hypothetical protein